MKNLADCLSCVPGRNLLSDAACSKFVPWSLKSECIYHISPSSDLYGTVRFLIKMARNVICFLNYEAQEAPTHTADTVSLSAAGYHKHGRNAQASQTEGNGSLLWCTVSKLSRRMISTQRVKNTTLPANHRFHIPLRQ